MKEVIIPIYSNGIIPSLDMIGTSTKMYVSNPLVSNIFMAKVFQKQLRAVF